VIDPVVLPRVSAVLTRTGELALDPAFRGAVADTLRACAAGLFVAAAVAVPLGALLGTLPRVESMTRPLVEFLRPIPSVALIPVAMFTFTDGEHAKIALVALTSSWPLLINTMYGVRDVDPVAEETLRAFGFGRAAVIVRVALPSAAPFVVTGLRIAVAVTLIVAIGVELFVGGTGIGTFLSQAGAGNQRESMLAAVVWTGVIGLLVNGVMVAAERRIFRWHHARTGEQTT
jgi:NitT/TauT family transport system permease protein